MKKIITLVSILIIFSGCASRLKVEIQIADRDKIIKADEKYPKEFNPAASIAALRVFINSWDTAKNANLILEFISKENKAEEETPELKAALKASLEKKIEEINQYYTAAASNFQNDNIEETKKALNTANLKLEELKQNLLVKYNIKVTSAGNTKELSKEVEAVKQTVENGSERTHFPILGDELASFIAKKSNDEIWKSVFNKTIASSFLGNTDIAMILRSNPPERELKSGDYNNNFTIKGVRMDASDVSNAIITGLTQTVSFIANTQGFPSNAGTTAAAVNNPLPNQNSLVLELDAEKIKVAQKKQKLADYTQLLLKKIALEDINSNDSDAQAQAKAKRILDYWTGLKTELAKP